jgi:hypothetical protein
MFACNKAQVFCDGAACGINWKLKAKNKLIINPVYCRM